MHPTPAPPPLTCPSLASLGRAAAAKVVSKAGPDAALPPWLARSGSSSGSGDSSGDLGRWRAQEAPRGAGAGAERRALRGDGDGDGGGGGGGSGRCVRSVARSAAEARGPQCARRPPAPAAPPPVWGPARGPRGGASLLAAPRCTPSLTSAYGSGSPRRPHPALPCPAPSPTQDSGKRSLIYFCLIFPGLTMPKRGSQCSILYLSCELWRGSVLPPHRPPK